MLFKKNKKPYIGTDRTVVVQKNKTGTVVVDIPKISEDKVKEQRLMETKRHFVHNEKMPLKDKFKYLSADNLNSFLIRLISVILVSLIMYKWLLKNEATIFHFMLILIAWGMVFIPETSRFNLIKHKIDTGKLNILIQGNMIAYTGGILIILLKILIPENPIFAAFDKYGILLILLMVICFEFYKTNLYEEDVFIPNISVILFSLVEGLFLMGCVDIIDSSQYILFQYMLIFIGPLIMNRLLYKINRNFGLIYCFYGELVLILITSLF